MKKEDNARWWLAGVVLVTLIVGATVLSALGRPLIDLLALVSLVVLPIMGAMGYGQLHTIKENVNGNTSQLMSMVQQQTQAAQMARAQEVRAAQEARENDKREMLALVRDALAANPPIPPPVSAPTSPAGPSAQAAA
jgi:hypothetical protein